MKLIKIIRESKKIVYTKLVKGRGDQDEEHKISSHDMPLPEFHEALQGLSAIVVKLLELDGTPWEKEIICKGIEKISENRSGVRTITLIAMRRFDHFIAPIEVKTPAFPIDILEGDDTKSKKMPNLNDDELNAILDFINEAVRYVDGNRAQGELSLDDDPYRPKSPSEQDDTQLGFDDINEEEQLFHKRIEACKTVKQLCEVVAEVFDADWTNSGMKLADLKRKAKETYAQNRTSLQK